MPETAKFVKRVIPGIFRRGSAKTFMVTFIPQPGKGVKRNFAIGENTQKKSGNAAPRR